MEELQGTRMMAATATPPPSALTSLISSSSTDSQTPTGALTIQILHNLQHQHLWRSLQIHDPYTLSPSQPMQLISGLPPQTVYTHPDEQIYMLENGIAADDIPVEREWVIPTAQGQSFSLKKLASVFDALPDPHSHEVGNNAAGGNVEAKISEYRRKKIENKWGGKRALFSMVDRGMGGDGTVVYYVVQEGAVKPRQN